MKTDQADGITSSCPVHSNAVSDECVSKDNVKADQPTEQTDPSSILSAAVKKELTKEKLKKARKQAYKKYADRLLLHRFNGIGKLGGGIQSTFPIPAKGNKYVWDGDNIRSGYPVHKMAKTEDANGNEVFDMDAFTCLTYNMLWQVNGPKFATQPTAAVDDVPRCMKAKGLALPVFIKRSLTKKGNKREGKTLGW
eukprot:962596-Ditylum_brightwellii.AAC.1